MADDRMAALESLRKAAADGDLDFLREGLAMLSQLVMDAEVTAQIGATHGERVPERRLTQRNGYRERRWDTRVGTIDLQIPKLRDGTYFPSLLEPRRRAERALLAVVQEAYVGGVGTRRVEELVGALGIVNLSKSEVSQDPCRARCRGRRLPLPPARGARPSVRLARCPLPQGLRRLAAIPARGH